MTRGFYRFFLTWQATRHIAIAYAQFVHYDVALLE